MYLEHFGLKELPFTLTPNTAFLVNLPTHVECLNLLLFAIRSGEGFIKIIGEVGTGKTLVCRKLLNLLHRGGLGVAYIPNPFLAPDDLYRAVAQELHVDVSTASSSHEVLNIINYHLIENAKQGKKTVLLIDEAQSMPAESIEALRLLSNLETETNKLIQIVLFGQPELDELLDQKALRQLKQRITSSYHINKLSPDHTERYISHRVNVAGRNGESLFNKQSIKAIYHGTGGVPRLINVVCNKSLQAAFGKGDRQVTRAHVSRALKDTEGTKKMSRIYRDRIFNMFAALKFG